MPSPTPFRLVRTARVKRPAGRPRKRSRQRQDAKPELKATVSQATVARLIDEACTDARFEGLDREFITEWVTSRLATFLEKYPWWDGHLDIDKPKQTRRATQAQLVALEKARQAKQARRTNLNGSTGDVPPIARQEVHGTSSLVPVCA